MAQVNLFTENFFVLNKIKTKIKKIIGRELRGPQAVEQSLFLGLKKLKHSYFLNQKTNAYIKTVGILSGVKTLAWAIKEKRAGRIDRIIAGPNITVSLKHDNGILLSPEIDVVVAPSPWVYDYYVKESPENKYKFRIWGAGVELPEIVEKNKIYDFLVYNKVKDNLLFNDICRHLESLGFKFKVLEYGNFNRADYFRLLEQSRFEIYLSESESQGLAMFEAWARNVPAFVWERGFWKTQSYSWSGNTASPYLTPETGQRFKDFEEFKKELVNFMSGQYCPRNYIENNFTNLESAKKYMEIYSAK